MVLEYGDVPKGKRLDDKEYEITERNLMNYYSYTDHLCLCLLDTQKIILFLSFNGIIIFISVLLYVFHVRSY